MADLKQRNVAFIATVLAFDVVAVWALSVGIPLNEGFALAARVGGAAIAGVVSVALNGLVPADLKAKLVFWRSKDVLPGHRAFSVHAVGDPRISLTSLEAKFGPLPVDPRAQSLKWYELYKRVEDKPAVSGAQRQWLLFRDLAVISLLVGTSSFALFCALQQYALGFASLALFIAQYFLCAVIARNHAVAFVTNVLAINSLAQAEKPITGL